MKSIPRLFVNFDLISDLEIKIIDNQFHYLINVLRKIIGDIVILVNGRDGEFEAKISDINKKFCMLKIQNQTRKFVSQPFLGLIFAPIKNMEIVAKMATELGVTDFIPVITEYTNAHFKEEKFLANVIEAVEQSERLDIPKVEKIKKLKDVLENIEENLSIVFCEERSKKIESNLFSQKMCALVGPEGGFSEAEKVMIKSYKQVVPISLGNLILRSETAVASILSVISLLHLPQK